MFGDMCEKLGNL